MYTYHIERNDSFYAVIADDGTTDGILVNNGNLTDRDIEQIDEQGISEDEYILALSKNEIATFERTGLTLWQRHNDALRSTWDVFSPHGWIISNYPTRAAADAAARPDKGEYVQARSAHQKAETPHH